MIETFSTLLLPGVDYFPLKLCLPQNRDPKKLIEVGVFELERVSAQPGLACQAGKYRIGEGQDPNILIEPDVTAVPPNQPIATNREVLGAMHFQGSI